MFKTGGIGVVLDILLIVQKNLNLVPKAERLKGTGLLNAKRAISIPSLLPDHCSEKRPIAIRAVQDLNENETDFYSHSN